MRLNPRPPLLWSTGRVKSLRRLRFAALFALASVLFSQLAVSAYACPGAGSMQLLAAVQEMPGCDEMPASGERSAICQAHCEHGDQSLDKASVAVPAVAMASVCGSVDWATPREGPAAQDSLLERPTGPPLAVRHCRFRI
jgi:hypothetical protein